MNTALFDKKGKKTQSKVTLDSNIFDVHVKDDLLSLAVYVYLSNQREANADTKDRSEVSGGGRKPWKQKGTGRARVGSSRNPIWKGGGVAFGPTNDRNYKRKLNRKVNEKAIKGALTRKYEAGDIIVIDDFKVAKTKEVEAVLKNLGVEGKVSFIQVEEEGLYNAAKNMPKTNVVRVGELSAYTVLNSGKLVILKSALDKISELWGKKVAKKEEKETKTVAEKAPAKKTVKKTVKKTTKAKK